MPPRTPFGQWLWAAKTRSTSEAKKPDHEARPSSPSSKPAVACRYLSAIISLLSCPYGNSSVHRDRIPKQIRKAKVPMADDHKRSYFGRFGRNVADNLLRGSAFRDLF